MKRFILLVGLLGSLSFASVMADNNASTFYALGHRSSEYSGIPRAMRDTDLALIEGGFMLSFVFPEDLIPMIMQLAEEGQLPNNANVVIVRQVCDEPPCAGNVVRQIDQVQ